MHDDTVKLYLFLSVTHLRTCQYPLYHQVDHAAELFCRRGNGELYPAITVFFHCCTIACIISAPERNPVIERIDEFFDIEFRQAKIIYHLSIIQIVGLKQYFYFIGVSVNILTATLR